ncbi:coiled-coil domain-containing protein 73 isoform X9 [Narcine bancroftii]|uniref:coiled-coil domain-containing protein 73 isoform X9 n=1 Tax=Narcine bancroftii TaxID=1343680 RepID=UPI0038315EF7
MRGKAARTRKGIRRFGKLIFLNSQMDNKMTGNLESSNDGLHITYNLQSSAPAVLCSVHQLEFKTSLLEMVEELRICRAAESRYEEQISKLVVEKQELEWQKQESLQNQNNALSSQHEEAIIALKKQFQIQVNAVEEEKGKFQLSSESKEREINGLKEELKILQVSKYNLEKKQSELEQKVNLQNIAKDNQLSQLSKVEKRFAAISHQYGLVIQAHGKLEQNVEEATRLNKKLMTMNENHESTIRELKQELEKVTADLIRSKVTSQYNLGEDNIHLTTQQQQLQELKQKLQMEIELNKKLSKEKSAVQEEKQEILKLFQQTQQLLQRQELALGRAETELKYFEEKHQGLERDNELLREKAKENEDKCQILERENEKSTGQWKKEETQLNKENQQIKSELESFKKAHASCQEIYSKLPAQTVHEQQMQAEQNILQHSEQATVQETAEEQTYASEALMDTDSKVKHLATHSHILEEVYEESNELGFKRQGNGNQNRMVNTDSPSTKRVNDTFNTSSVPLYPKRNSKEDWNAIPQTFCDFSRPPEQEKLCSPISESFKILNQPSFTGHKQFTESSSTCFQVPEVATSTTKNLLFEEESDTAYSMVKGQIDKIERFLCVERLKHTRKRKAADNTDKHVSKVTPT